MPNYKHLHKKTFDTKSKIAATHKAATDSSDTMKIAKFLAHSGVASRRNAEELILAGKVKINGKVETNVAERVDPLKDSIEFNGKPLNLVHETVVLALNKPRGVVSTVSDPDGKPTVMQYIPEEYKKYRLFPVGRLDEDSEGLILLTNDGNFAYSLTHPGFHVPKTYIVAVQGKVNQRELYRLRTGVPLKDGQTMPALVKVQDQVSNVQRLQITLTEGRNRQIRRMMQAVNHPVVLLKRITIGPFSLGNLGMGKVTRVKPELMDNYVIPSIPDLLAAQAAETSQEDEEDTSATE